jgi:hypothetical protein
MTSFYVLPFLSDSWIHLGIFKSYPKSYNEEELHNGVRVLHVSLVFMPIHVVSVPVVASDDEYTMTIHSLAG